MPTGIDTAISNTIESDHDHPRSLAKTKNAYVKSTPMMADP
jgi:hypothetical protein